MRAVLGREVRRSLSIAKKFALSCGLTTLLPSPCIPGYSQSMSMPSRLYCLYSATMLLTKVFRESEVAHAGEKYLIFRQLKDKDYDRIMTHLLPPQPPMLTLTLVPLAWAAETTRWRIFGEDDGSSNARLNFWSGVTKAKSIQSKRVISIFSGGRVDETQSG